MPSRSSTSNSEPRPPLGPPRSEVEPKLAAKGNARISPPAHPEVFAPNKLERMPRGRFPLAAVALIVIVVVIEIVLSHQRVWFADRAAWQWQVKRDLMDAGRLDGDVAVLGSSILFHSIDAPRATELAGGKLRVTNLALNGAALQQQSQLLAEYLTRGRPPAWVVLELPKLFVSRESWLRGPYWRFWAKPGEFLASKSYYHEPSLPIAFATNHLLTSFSYRAALDNFLSASIRAHRPVTTYLERNREVLGEMAQDRGYSPGEFVDGMTVEPTKSDEPSAWTTNLGGEVWVRRLLRQCVDNHIKVLVLLPPGPPYMTRRREGAGYFDGFNECVAGLRREFPTLAIDVLAPKDYELSDFADDVHLSRSGRTRLTAELATWVRSLGPNH